MICFVEALVIGFFLQDVFRHKNKKTVLSGSALATVICGSIAGICVQLKNIKVPNHKVAAGVICLFCSLSAPTCSWNFCQKAVQNFSGCCIAGSYM